MLESKQILSYDDPSKTFRGVRFFLCGFDSVKEDQVRAKLLEGGGIDAINYGPDCNHVIVDKLVYDDPMCVAARRDGKTLVTGLWVDHSFDVGMPVDPTSVMYWPRRNVNGIPGAESLVVCLTGYQRQDRDDIMTMVALMGANFSKPLVASKVTHLICYKFEGEKYELAKKIKKIKLINHCWLEDCLKAWELLPESNYAKSGYELEIEAEAKDSEEETEDIASMALRKKSVVSPQNTRLEKKIFHQPPVNHEVSRNSSFFTASESFANVGDTSKIQSNPRKEIDYGHASFLQVTHDTHLEKSSSCGRSPGKKSSEVPLNIIQGVTISENVEHAIPCASRSVKKSPDADLSKSSSKSRKLSLSPRPEIIENHSGSPAASGVHKPGFSGGFNMPLERHQIGAESLGVKTPLKGTLLHLNEGLANSSHGKGKVTVSRGSSRSPMLRRSPKKSMGSGLPLERHQDGTDSHGVKTPLKGTLLHLDEGLANSSHSKGKVTVSHGSSRSPMFSRSPKKSLGSGLSTKTMEAPVSGSSLDGSRRLHGDVSPTNVTSHMREEANGGFDMPMERHLDGIDPDGVQTPLKGTSLHLDQGQTGDLPSKRKKTSRGSSRSPMSSHYAKTSIGSRLAAEVMELPVSGSSLIDVSGGLAGDISPTNVTNCLKEDPSLAPKEALSISATSEGRRNDQTVQHSCEGLKQWTSSNLAMEGLSSGVEKMDDQADLNNTRAEGSGTQLKLQKKKTLSRKTLGSRPTIEKGCTTKQKGHINNLQNVLHNECLNHSNEAVAMEGIDNASISEKVAVISPTTNENEPVDDETKAPDDKRQNVLDMESDKEDSAKVEASYLGTKITNKKKKSGGRTTKMKEKGEESVGVKSNNEAVKSVLSNKTEVPESKSTGEAGGRKITKGKKRPLTKSKTNKSNDSREEVKNDETESKKDEEKTDLGNEETVVLACKINKRQSKKLKSSTDEEKENRHATIGQQSVSTDTGTSGKLTPQTVKKPLKNGSKVEKANPENFEVKTEPAWFILSGHKLQRKEFQQVIKRLKGRVCRDSHNWSYQATHFIVPDPVRRTEKFFAAAASGSWILKTDYLTASNEAGRFLSEESYEWNKKCLTEDGAINLEAPRKWRLVRERTGHGAFYGMQIVIYGECIAPPLDTLKRAVKAGDGTILATSPPYTRFIKSGIDFAIVSPGMPRVDIWVQEFLRHEVPCIVADYLVEYVCKPGYPLERHVQYNTHAWAQKSLENLVKRVEEVADDNPTTPDQSTDDVACSVCGSRDRGEEMLICGDESGNHGCGVGVHIDCLDPPLNDVPEEDWFCGECSRKQAMKTVSRGSKKGTSKSKK